MTELTTARLTLRSLTPADFDALFALVSDYEVAKMTASWPHPADPELTRARCQPYAGTGFVFGAFAGPELVGVLGVTAEHDPPELGYMFARAHWGRGLASEACRAAVNHAFASFDWPEIAACVFDDNPASARVLEKLGFEATGPCTGSSAARASDALPTQNFRLARGKAAAKP
ncbi:MAG: GNAT family N-acetyltransferase [Rhodobacterales bacterium]|nr:MAG: GNAT family N-acetyltransferase [Rhodobacterales bacterium]